MAWISSCAGAVLQQFNAIDRTIKLLNGDVGCAGAGPLHCDVIVAWSIMALVAVVTCVRKTHIGFIFVFIFGRAGCSSGGAWPLPRKAPPWAAAPATRSAGSADIVAASPGGVHKHAIHDYVCLVRGTWFASSRWDGGCDARAGLRSRRSAWTSLLQVRLVFTIFFQTRFTSVAALLRCSKHGNQTARRCLSPCHATSDSLTA